MTVQQSGRTRKFLVSTNGELKPGETLDRLVLFLPNGDVLDVSGGGGGGGFKGVWQPDTDYAAGSIVGIPHDSDPHQLFIYGTDVDIPAGAATPGVDPNEAVYGDGPGGSAPIADYNRIDPGPQSYDYVDGWAYFFFDLSAGGHVAVSSTVFQQVPVLYDFSGESVWSGGLGAPVSADVPVGRYFVALQNGQGGSGTETVTLTLSDGAAIPDPDAFWYGLG